MSINPEAPQPIPRKPQLLVLDTNIVLDLLLFQDPDTRGLASALRGTGWQCIASEAMRDELGHVLAYAHIERLLLRVQSSATQLLAQYAALVHIVACAPRASAICKDTDDQKFIDLAVQYGAVLLSKDKAVLALRKRLVLLGVQASTARQFSP